MPERICINTSTQKFDISINGTPVRLQNRREQSEFRQLLATGVANGEPITFSSTDSTYSVVQEIGLPLKLLDRDPTKRTNFLSIYEKKRRIGYIDYEHTEGCSTFIWYKFLEQNERGKGIISNTQSLLAQLTLVQRGTSISMYIAPDNIASIRSNETTRDLLTNSPYLIETLVDPEVGKLLVYMYITRYSQ